MTISNEVADDIPDWLCYRLDWFRRGKRWLFIPLLAGLFQSINTPILQDSIFSGLTSTVITYTLIQLWRRSGGIRYSMRQLLPSKRESRVLLCLLVLMYVMMGVFWRPEALPGIGGQSTVWILYLFFGGLLVLGLRKSKTDELVNSSRINIPNRSILIFGLVFTFGSVLGKITGLSFPTVYFIWFGGILFGLLVLCKTISGDNVQR